MRLHRYFGTHADTTFEEGRLLYSRVSSFNDPFEFVIPFTGTPTLEQTYRDLQNALPHEEALKFALERKHDFGSGVTEEQIVEDPISPQQRGTLTRRNLSLSRPDPVKQLFSKLFGCGVEDVVVLPRIEVQPLRPIFTNSSNHRFSETVASQPP
jgi:hypothetical protein